MKNREDMVKKYASRTVPSEQVNLVDGTTKMYLPLSDQLSMFRELNPDGKISVLPIKMESAFCIVEARVYLDKNDPEFVANSIVSRFANMESDMFARAVAAARSSALSAAGFGCQFASTEDLEPSETVNKPTMAASPKEEAPAPVEKPETKPANPPEMAAPTSANPEPSKAIADAEPVPTPAPKTITEGLPQEVKEAFQVVWPFGKSQGSTLLQLSETGQLAKCIYWFLSQEARWGEHPELLTACRVLDTYAKSHTA